MELSPAHPASSSTTIDDAAVAVTAYRPCEKFLLFLWVTRERMTCTSQAAVVCMLVLFIPIDASISVGQYGV